MKDDQRISEVVQRERSRLRNFVRQRVADREDAEDIVQDVFSALVEANRLLMPIDHVTGWLFRVARNRIIDLFRKRQVEPLSDAPDALEGYRPSSEPCSWRTNWKGAASPRGGEVVRSLWNYLVPPIFGWREITFWQAVGLLALCRILFGGFGLHGSSRSHSGLRHRLADRMADRVAARWEHMTPEERERFRQRIRERCGVDLATGDRTGQ